MQLDFAPGQVIAGRYVLQELLGVGGMGEVWAAQHRSLKRDVAIKLIRSRWFDDNTIISRFIREARSAASIKGPNIVDVFDHGQDGHIVYIVMERLRGLSLRAVMKALPGPVAYSDIRHLLKQVMIGLGRAHEKGIIHRDIKPSNIFILPHPDGWQAKLVDFGLAKPTQFTGDESFELHTRQGVLLGTPAYMSPERLQESDSTIHSDLWAVAVMAFELICNTRPFSGSNPMGLMVRIATERPPAPSSICNVPPGIDEWFAQATAPELADRFEHIRALVKPLEHLLSDEYEEPNRVTVTEVLNEHMSPEDISLSISGHSAFYEAPDDTVMVAPVTEHVHTVQETRTVQSEVTSVKVSELQTQIQYRLMEQLRSEREKNRALTEQLAEKSEKDEQ